MWLTKLTFAGSHPRHFLRDEGGLNHLHERPVDQDQLDQSYRASQWRNQGVHRCVEDIDFAALQVSTEAAIMRLVGLSC